MTADFEQLIYNGEMLKNSWKNQMKHFEKFASNGTVDKGVIDFITWILTTNNSEKLFAGSSMWNLLISKPKNKKLNYQQTLKIQFDNRTSLYEMEYSDWDSIDKEDDYEKAIIWKTKCIGIELPIKFLEFIKWNKNWR